MKKVIVGLFMLVSASAFAECTLNLTVYEDSQKITDRNLEDTITKVVKEELGEKNIKVTSNDEANYQLEVHVHWIASDFDEVRGTPVDSWAGVMVKNPQGEVLFYSKKLKHAQSFLFIPARYERINAKAVKKALKEVECPNS